MMLDKATKIPKLAAIANLDPAAPKRVLSVVLSVFNAETAIVTASGKAVFVHAVDPLKLESIAPETEQVPNVAVLTVAGVPVRVAGVLHPAVKRSVLEPLARRVVGARTAIE